MTCHTCGCETPFGVAHGDPLSCILALKRENEVLRQLLCMSLVDEAATADVGVAGRAPARWVESPGTHAAGF